MFYQCISNYLRESKFLDRVIEEHSKRIRKNDLQRTSE